MRKVFPTLIFGTILSLIAFPLFSQVEKASPDDYIISRITDESGNEIVGIIVPGRPPGDHREPIAMPNRSSVLLPNVPAFTWVFGCSATAAAMAAGYYDNNGYPDMYTGPTNGGVMPMNNSTWGTVVINGETRALCPLSATMDGLDGRTGRGHVDDYWVQYNSSANDPYITNSWTQHTYEDCTGDFMGTNQSALGNVDGATTFYFYTNGNLLYNYTGCEPGQIDGCHGMRDFYESRGYTVIDNYSQYIYGYEGNTIGFTFQQYKDEIDAGRPVMIQVAGHSMLGVGYDDSGNTVYLHDTWDYNLHTMTWGGSYSGMAHYGVTVVELDPQIYGPVANFAADILNPLINTTVTFTDLSTGNPAPDTWSWTITPSTFIYVNSTSSASQNPQVQFTTTGAYTVLLTVSNSNNSDTETKTDYIQAMDCNNITLPLSEDFSSGNLPNCWSIVDHQGNGQVWAFNNPGNRTINTASGANGFAILDSDYYGQYNSQNCDLVSPLLDLSDVFGVVLTFQHYFVEYSGSAANLSYSTDNGTNWSVLQSWSNSTVDGETYSQDISDLVAGYAQVRFKWNYTGSWGWFWAIDDVIINTDVPGLWTGVVSNDWNNTGNWCNHAVPGSTTDVTIHTSAVHWPEYGGSLLIGTDCGNVTIPGSSEMTVTGDLVISEGSSLVFEGDGLLKVSGDWNNMGTFVAGTGTVEFTGSTGSSIYGGVPFIYTIGGYTRSTFTKGITFLTGGTAGPTGSNVSMQVPLGFSFDYIGDTYDQAYISIYGILTFSSAGASSIDNPDLFTVTAPNSVITPWWDYLKADGSSAISYKTDGASPDRVFTVEWYNIVTFNTVAKARISFQLKLFEGSNLIEFHYGNVTGTSHSGSESASIGIEDNVGGSGHFIEATTGSTTTGIHTLKSSVNWPSVNYRFSPPAAPVFTEQFHHIVISKTGQNIEFEIDAEISGSLSISPGANLTISEGKTVSMTGMAP